MHTVTIQGNIYDAVEWAMHHFDNSDWNLDFVDIAAPVPSYRFIFSKMEAASHFALRWKDV
jgi:hypothetical protein